MSDGETEPKLRTALAVVVPCYNAGESVRAVVEGLRQYVNRVYVVDDGSTDGCTAGLAEAGARMIAFRENRGKGHAILAGFRAALEEPEVQAVAVVDADGQHDAAELPGLFATMIRERADLLIGSRNFDQAHVPLRSWFGNKMTALVTRLLLRQAIRDTQSGYRIHARRLVEHLLGTVPGGRYDTEMEILVRAVKGGWRVVASPIQTIYEAGNTSSHFNKLRDSWQIYVKLIRTALRT